MRACVYLLNNKTPYIDMASYSISMLRKHNTSIKIVCLCVGEIDLPFEAEKIQVENLMPNFFLANKQHIGIVDYEEVLFIDCDTFIFGDVEKLFDYDYDFVGCQNNWAYFKGFNLFKPTNSGVMLFKNNAHKKILYKFSKKLKTMDVDYPELDAWLKNTNEWVREEFLISQIANDLSIKSTFFKDEDVRMLQWNEDFERMHKSIIFHSFTQQWETALHWSQKSV